MAKSQRRTNREAKKPKKAAVAAPKSPAPAIAGVRTPVAATSYKDRFK